MKTSIFVLSLTVFCWGTADAQDNYIGPAHPSFMVKAGPDVEVNKGHGNAEYITAFSQLRVGNQSSGILGVMPAVGALEIEPDAYRSTFDCSASTATSGYYSVELKDHEVQVDMTALDHVAAYRFTFPESRECHVLVDVSHFLENFGGGEVRLRDDKTIEGTAIYKIGNNEEVEVAFSFQFSKPFKRRGTWAGGEADDKRNSARADAGSTLGAFVYFWTHEGETILMKVGLSYENVEGAREQLGKEFPGWDFKQLCRESAQR